MQYGRHDINDADIEAVVRVLKSDYITSGHEVPLFEKNISEFCGVKYGIAVNSGTSALECALAAINVKDCKVIVPNITFVATANAVINQGGEVVLCDVTESGHIDVDALGRLLYATENIVAVISVDFAGIPCDYDKINALCVRHNIIHISDASHSLGAFYKSSQSGEFEPVGSLADITCFSFHPVKTITTAEGGMCVTNDRNAAAYMRMYRSHGVDKTFDSRDDYKYDVIIHGHNYRMNELSAALGNSQMSRIKDFVSHRMWLAHIYGCNINNSPLLNDKINPILKYMKYSNYTGAHHLYVVRVDENKRDIIYTEMKKRKINCNVHYPPLSTLSVFSAYRGDLDVSEKMATQFLTLPLHFGLSKEDIDYVCAQLEEVIKDIY